MLIVLVWWEILGSLYVCLRLLNDIVDWFELLLMKRLFFLNIGFVCGFCSSVLLVLLGLILSLRGCEFVGLIRLNKKVCLF